MESSLGSTAHWWDHSHGWNHYPSTFLSEYYTGDLWSVFGEAPLHTELQVWLEWHFSELHYSCLWLENLARSSCYFFVLRGAHACLKVIRHACSTSRLSKLKYSKYCRVLKSIVQATKNNKNHLKLTSSNLTFYWCVEGMCIHYTVLWTCFKFMAWSSKL